LRLSGTGGGLCALPAEKPASAVKISAVTDNRMSTSVSQRGSYTKILVEMLQAGCILNSGIRRLKRGGVSLFGDS